MIQVLCFARSARTSARLELCRRREIRFIKVFVRVTIAFFGQTESDRVEFAIGLTKLLLTCWEARGVPRGVPGGYPPPLRGVDI